MSHKATKVCTLIDQMAIKVKSFWLKFQWSLAMVTLKAANCLSILLEGFDKGSLLERSRTQMV